MISLRCGASLVSDGGFGRRGFLILPIVLQWAEACDEGKVLVPLANGGPRLAFMLHGMGLLARFTTLYGGAFA